MRVTVCELQDGPGGPADEWPALVDHARSHRSDLVLLPEMPFDTWLARSAEPDLAAWDAAVRAHEEWSLRFAELAPAAVLGTRPLTAGGRRFNEGFAWDERAGDRALHRKYYLPDEECFWEASWYERGDGDFASAEVAGARVGFLVCTEIWFTEHARAYARAGVQLLAAPRATLASSVDKWLAGGRAAAVMAGAFCLSSNRGGVDEQGSVWAGSGWIIEPEEGELLARTSTDHPFVTLEIDLAAADAAKGTYPRYVPE